jgi:minichromosome maintenance protein 10
MDDKRPTVQINGSTSQHQQKSKFSLNKRLVTICCALLKMVFSFVLIISDIKINKLVICSSSSSGAKGPPKQGLGKAEQDFKRRKVDNPPKNIIELDAVSSDDDEISIVPRH